MDDILQHETLRGLEAAIVEEEEKLMVASRSVSEHLNKLRSAFEELAQDLQSKVSNAETTAVITKRRLDQTKEFLGGLSLSDPGDTARIAELEKALEAATAETASLRDHAGTLERTHGEHLAALDAARERLAQLETEAGQAKAEAEKANAAVLEAERALEAAGAAAQEAAELREVNARLHGEAEEARARLNVAESARGDSDSVMQTLKDVAESLRAELDAANKAVEESKTALTALQAEAEALQHQKADTELARAEIEAAHAAAREEATGLRANAEAAEADRKQLALDRDAAQNALGERDAQLAALAAERDAARTETQTLKSRQADAENAAEELRKELSTTQHILSAAREELDALKQSAAAAAQESSAAAAKLADAEKQLEEERAKNKKSVLAAELAAALKDAEELKDQVAQLKARLDSQNSSGELSEDERIVTAARKRGKHTIASILAEAGILTSEQADAAVAAQRENTAKFLGDILVDKGYASETAVAKALAALSGNPFVRLSEQVVSAESTALVSDRLAKQHKCIPVRIENEMLVIAMSNPLDLVAIEDLEHTTNRPLRVLVATRRDIQQAIETFYWEP